MSKKQKFRINATRDLPEDINKVFQDAKKAACELEEISLKRGLKRKFSLDGRFLGDIGELLVHLDFDVELSEKQKAGSDAKLKDGTPVEIKLRSLSDHIELSCIPKLLLVIYICPETSKWEVIYNGPGEYLPHREQNGKKEIVFAIKELSEFNETLPPNARRVPNRPKPQ